MTGQQFHHLSLRLRDRQRGSRHLSATRWRVGEIMMETWRWTMKHIEHKGISSVMLHMLHSSKKSCFFWRFFCGFDATRNIFESSESNSNWCHNKNAERQL